jgi:Tol biopolymer transport system component
MHPPTSLQPGRTWRLRVGLLALCLAATSCTASPASSGSGAASADPSTASAPLVPSASPSTEPTPGDATSAAGLAFIRPVDGVDRVFVIDADGSARQVSGLNANDAPGAERPIWSPDRSMIAFAPPKIGAGLDPQLRVVNADGTAERPIFDIGESTNWSPDSSRLLFCDSVFTTDNTGEPARMWIAEVATGQVTQLDERGTGPRWVPDGESISYHPDPLADPQGNATLSILPLDGGQPRRLAEGSGGWWAPDGRGFLAARDGGLWLHQPDGSDPQPLVKGDEPVWSPQIDRIAYAHLDQSGTFAVGVVDLEGQVIWSDVIGSNAAWSPDGTKLAVEVGSADFMIHILDATNGALLWQLEGRHPTW